VLDVESSYAAVVCCSFIYCIKQPYYESRVSSKHSIV